MPVLAPARSRPRRRRPSGTQGDAVPREAWRRLAVCTAAAALLQVDGTLITVALPSVAKGLGVSGASTATVLSVYFVAYALVLLPAGACVDTFGARRVARFGLALFAAGAAGGALAPTLTVLLITRAVQGAGAALVSPAALAGAVSGFPPPRRGAALGIWGASAGAANLLGPLLGGVITVTLGWRADWWTLVPLTAVVGAAITVALPAGLTGEPRSGGPATVLNRIVVGAAGVAALTFVVMIGSFYLAEQYLQRTAHFSALGASSVLVLVALLVGAAAPLAGRLSDARGERWTALLGFSAVGTGLAILALPAVSLHTGVTLLPLVPTGLGLGLLFVPASRAALGATPPSLHGRTSAVLSFGRLVGAGVGTAVAGAALSGGPRTSTIHLALFCGCALCLLVGAPLATRLARPAPARMRGRAA